MNRGFEVVGGAGPEETAAIAAVIASLREEEAAAMATPSRPPRQSSWVLAWRPREIPAPLPSHTFDSGPSSDFEQNDADS
jgi:hypothetical protein